MDINVADAISSVLWAFCVVLALAGWAGGMVFWVHLDFIAELRKHAQRQAPDRDDWQAKYEALLDHLTDKGEKR